MRKQLQIAQTRVMMVMEREEGRRAVEEARKAEREAKAAEGEGGGGREAGQAEGGGGGEGGQGEGGGGEEEAKQKAAARRRRPRRSRRRRRGRHAHVGRSTSKGPARNAAHIPASPRAASLRTARRCTAAGRRIATTFSRASCTRASARSRGAPFSRSR